MKDMDNIKVGDPATFTVDAFGSEQFKGIVDEVAPTSEQSSVVFNISDERPTNQFAVYVRLRPDAISAAEKRHVRQDLGVHSIINNGSWQKQR